MEPGEECDEGIRNSTSPNASCRPDCHSYRCGDAVLDAGEQCDDGNRRAGDSCDRFCRSEKTLVAAENLNEENSQFSILNSQFQSQSLEFPFPQQGMPNYQQFSMLNAQFQQLPLTQLQSLISVQPATAQTGPAAIAMIGAGAAAGWSWMKRKRK